MQSAICNPHEEGKVVDRNARWSLFEKIGVIQHQLYRIGPEFLLRRSQVDNVQTAEA